MKPIRLREQVKRNALRFPERFRFQLSDNELNTMVSQFATPSLQSFGGALPYVFTEHGVLMLANVLKSKQAIEVSLGLLDIFVKMREMLSVSKDVLLKLEQLEKRITGHDAEIKIIFTTLKNLFNSPPKPRRRVGYRRKDETD